MRFLDHPIVRFLRSCRLRFFKAMFLLNYKEILSSGNWRDAMRSAVVARDHDIILEVPATTFQMSEPVMNQHSNVTFASLGASPQTDPNRQIKFENEKLDCSGASFDKIACCMALHPLPSPRKLAMLKELRRVLRQGGTLYVADFDRPHTHRETIALNGTDYLFGSDRRISIIKEP